MKKIKSCITWLCALLFLLASISLSACGNKNQATQTSRPSGSVSDILNSSDIETQPPTDDETESGSSSLPDGSSESKPPQSSVPPASSSPTSSAPTSSAPSTQNSTAQYVRCNGDSVNIRSGAGTGYTVLGTAKKGTMYAIIGKTGSWYKTYYRGQVAYLSTSYFSVVEMEKSDDKKVENVLLEGYKLIGTPYVYGAVRVHDGTGKLLKGFSAQKFDCSSLVQYIFYKGADKILQVHTRTQVKQGKYVKPSDLQRGDCIFFTNEDRQYNTGVERVGHVAIYLGDDYILHTASDYARIEKMTAYRWNFYIEARRFL